MLASKNGDVTTVQEILDTQATSGNISNYRNAVSVAAECMPMLQPLSECRIENIQAQS